jgi:hypothetical protein
MTETQIRKHMDDVEYQKSYIIVRNLTSGSAQSTAAEVRPKLQKQKNKRR